MLKTSTVQVRPILAVLGVYLGALAFAAAFCPLAYLISLTLAEAFPQCGWLLYLANHPVEAYFERIRMLASLGVLPFFLKYYKLNSWNSIGIDWSDYKNWLRGLAIGCSIMLIMNGIALMTGSCTFRMPPSPLSWLTPFFSGVLIGLLEECLFRGIVLRLFSTRFNQWAAITLCSLFFAYTHFKTPCTAYALDRFTGFRIAIDTILGIFYTFNAMEFCILFALSSVFCLMTRKTGNLMLAIGTHSGLVWLLLTQKKCLTITPSIGAEPFLGTGILQHSPIALIALIVLGIYYFTPKKKLP